MSGSANGKVYDLDPASPKGGCSMSPPFATCPDHGLSKPLPPSPPPTPLSVWRVCCVCGAEVDTRWWKFGHAVHCFPASLKERGEEAFRLFYAEVSRAG